VLQCKVDHLVRHPAGDGLDGNAVSLAEVSELLSPNERVVRLCSNRIKEHRKPTIDIPLLAD
jgi:hypothetical protein